MCHTSNGVTTCVYESTYYFWLQTGGTPWPKIQVLACLTSFVQTCCAIRIHCRPFQIIFDRVDYGLLIQDLHELGISGIYLRWFCSYLSSRFQRVTTPTATADTVHCARGVPRGVLGPLLFCIYIRDVPAQFRHSNSQLYADDIAFYNNSTK